MPASKKVANEAPAPKGSAKTAAAKKTAAKKAPAKTAAAKKAPAKTAAAKSATPSAGLHKGDKVSWNTPQGQTQGTVTRKVTGTAHVDGPSTGHTAKASKADPQYEVESAKSGKKAIHKADALHKTG